MSIGEQTYGFCGLNISNSHRHTLKSVGGIVIQDRYHSVEPVVGVAEYKVTTANRSPDDLAAPREAIAAWAKEQIERVLRGSLNGYERELASTYLGDLVDDVRSIFYVPSSRGGLDIKGLRSALIDHDTIYFPISRYSMGGVLRVYASLPHVGELSLTYTEIDFSCFAICPRSAVIELTILENGSCICDVAPHVYKNAWSATINTARDLNLDFDITYLSKFELGTYKGPGSARHGLEAGDRLQWDVLRVKLNRHASK